MRIVAATLEHLHAVGATWATSVPPGALAGLTDDGRAVVVGGFVELLPWAAEAWVRIAPGAPRLAVARAMCRVLAVAKWRRVQCACVVGADRALRLAEWLGFESEGVMRGWEMDGSDCWRLAVVRAR